MNRRSSPHAASSCIQYRVGWVGEPLVRSRYKRYWMYRPSPGRRAGPQHARRGAMLIYATVAMVVFAGLCVLAVDWGRVQVAKTELQRTADVAGLSDSTTLTKANWIGGQNAADGRAVVFQA